MCRQITESKETMMGFELTPDRL